MVNELSRPSLNIEGNSKYGKTLKYV